MRRPHVSVGKCPGLARVGKVLGANGVLCTCYCTSRLLFTLLGAKTSTKTRIISAIAEQIFDFTIQKWRLPSGEVPSAVFQAKAGLSRAVAR